MKDNRRRITKLTVTFISIITLLLVSSIPAFAKPPKITEPTVTVDMVGTTVSPDNGVITPDTTVYGEGGTATLNWMSSNKSFVWNVDPVFTGFEFVGNIHVHYVYLNTGFDIPVSGIGLGSVGDVTNSIDIKTGIKATLTGVATSITGKTAKVADGCSISVYP